MNMNGQGLDLATYINSALNRSGSGDGWGNGDGGFLWILLVLLLAGGAWGNGWGNRGGAGGATGGGAESVDRAIAQARADGLSDQVVIDAVQGNAAAISQLASTLNCDINAIQTVLCGMDKSIMQVANQVGLTSTQIINAVQSGNCQISQQIAQCCCSMEKLVLQNSHATQIATMEQTQTLTGTMNAGFAALASKIDAETTAINNNFQSLRDYLTTEKIAGLQHTITQMENAANNANQTLAFRAALEAATIPIQNQVNLINSKIPPTPVPTYPLPQYPFGIIPNNGCCSTSWNGC